MIGQTNLNIFYDEFAVVQIITIYGSVVTVTFDNVTKILDPTTAHNRESSNEVVYYYIVHKNKFGSYTFSATLSDESVTSQRTINFPKRYYTIKLFYRENLYVNGGGIDTNLWILGSLHAQSPVQNDNGIYFYMANSSTKNWARRSYMYTNKKIDLTPFSYLVAIYQGLKCNSGGGSHHGVYLMSDSVPDFANNGFVNNADIGYAEKVITGTDTNTYSGEWTIDLTNINVPATIVVSSGQYSSDTTINRYGYLTVSHIALS